MTALVAVGALLLLALAASGTAAGRWPIGPGGGGTTEVRYVAHPGEPVRLLLDVTVWGAGDGVEGRYGDLRLRYTIANAAPQQVVDGRLVLREKNRERYEFTVHPYRGGESGRLDYFFEMTFDGRRTTSPGKQDIEVPPAGR